MVPILMYHSISEELNPGATHPYYKTNTSPAVFSLHMEYLYKNNYRILNLDETVVLLKKREPVRDKYAVITFDDGFRDFYTEAFPLLHRYEFKATVFLPTAYIGKKRVGFNGIQCLSWDEVRDLRLKGIDFGSHTVSHPQLHVLGKKEIEHEITHSKTIIENNLGCPIESFSYPFAFPEDSVFKNYIRGFLEKCGYKYGVSTRIGTTHRNDNFFSMKRIPVNSHDDIPLFKAKLEGSYDWMYFPQYLFKKFKISSNKNL